MDFTVHNTGVCTIKASSSQYSCIEKVIINKPQIWYSPYLFGGLLVHEKRKLGSFDGDLSFKTFKNEDSSFDKYKLNFCSAPI